MPIIDNDDDNNNNNNNNNRRRGQDFLALATNHSFIFALPSKSGRLHLLRDSTRSLMTGCKLSIAPMSNLRQSMAVMKKATWILAQRLNAFEREINDILLFLLVVAAASSEMEMRERERER